MPAVPEKKAYTVEDYAGFLAGLDEAGFEFVVIGGCAVGAYAHLRGETIFSGDLDLYGSDQTLDKILAWAVKHGVKVLKRPQPRSIPTAFLMWEGKEVNVLTYATGLPEPEVAIRLARIFELSKHGGLEVDVADPFDLLENKIRVNRPKDRPHIDFLIRFVEEEVVEAFTRGSSRRERLGPARRFLAVTRSRTLPEGLAGRLLPLAGPPSDLRFLLNHVPREDQARALLAKEMPAEVEAELRQILGHRRFPPSGSASPKPLARPLAPAAEARRARAPASGRAARRKA